MKRSGWFGVCLASALVCGTAGAALQVGDPAPTLTVTEWVKGEPVDLGAAKGKNIVVVEFWATWCGPCIQAVPHMTEMQAHYRDQGVIFIGVSAQDPENPLDKVKEFVKSKGDKMAYRVAFDADRKTYESYMTAAEQGGIPTAFIVDREGRIAWIGHPMGGLEDALDEMVTGKFDIEVAKQMAALDRQSQEAWDRGDTAGIVAIADKRISLKPNSGDAYASKFYALQQAEADPKVALATATKAVELWQNHANKLADFATYLVDKDDKSGFNDLAKKALDRALTIKGDDPQIAMAQYQVLAEIGDESGALLAAEKGITALKAKKDSQGLTYLANILSDPENGEKCSDLALRAVELAIEIEPENPSHLMSKFRILANCKKDAKAAATTGEYLIEKAVSIGGREMADLLNAFAWSLMTETETKGRFNELALKSAIECDKISKGEQWMHLDTLALAKFETGAAKEAVELESKAIELARQKGMEGPFMNDLQSALERFKKGAETGGMMNAVENP